MTKNELCNVLKNNRKINEKCFKERYPVIYLELNSIKFPDNFTFRQKLYHYVYNDLDLKLGVCYCGNRCRFKNFKHGYSIYCSMKCVQNSDAVKHKKEDTCMKHFGVKHSTQAESCKAKSRKTKLEKHGDEYYTNRELCWKTCEERHGVRNPFQMESVKEKSKQTNLKKRGVEHFSQSNEFKEKFKETMLFKHDCEYPLQSEEFMKKTINTNLEKYNVPFACMRKEARMKGNNSKPNRDFEQLLIFNNIDCI